MREGGKEGEKCACVNGVSEWDGRWRINNVTPLQVAFYSPPWCDTFQNRQQDRVEGVMDRSCKSMLSCACVQRTDCCKQCNPSVIPSPRSEAAGSTALGHHVVVGVGASCDLVPAEELTVHMLQPGSARGSDDIQGVIVVVVMYICVKCNC